MVKIPRSLHIFLNITDKLTLPLSHFLPCLCLVFKLRVSFVSPVSCLLHLPLPFPFLTTSYRDICIVFLYCALLPT